MMRALGVLAGIGVTVAAFLLLLDSRESRQPELLSGDSGNATAQELSVVAAAITEQVDVVPAGNDSDQAVAARQQAAPVEAEPQGGFELSGPDPDRRPDLQAEAETDGSDREGGGAAGTYLFWSPFRSLWSAQGFAGRLTSATQVPVEVVTTAPGKYRVAFSYQDETERLARIGRIETITGLKLE